MEIREQIITDCFQFWIEKDGVKFERLFSPDAVYIESWGPAYRNLRDIMKWFNEWNAQNHVLQWDIKNFWHSGKACICEWYFKCRCGGVTDGFDGVSVIEFNDEDRIVSLKEYQSKIPNYYPYEK